MDDLIRITVVDGGDRVVSGRELYALMGIKTPYTMWMDPYDQPRLRRERGLLGLRAI